MYPYNTIEEGRERKENKMTKYTATFQDGHRIAKTSEEVKNRVDFYNKLCRSEEAKGHGRIVSIEARPYGKN